MKNILIKLLLVLSLLSFSWFSYVWNTYAEWDWITVIVTEKIPGAGCNSLKSDWKTEWKLTDTEIKEWKTQMYECIVKKGFWSVAEMMWKIIKYFTYIASLWAVLFIVINGIMYSMWWADPSLKDDAKKRIMWTLWWLVLLFLSWAVLNLVAPWIYK